MADSSPLSTCPRCNAPLQAGQRFCPNCALPLDPASLTQFSAAQRPAAPPKRRSTVGPGLLLIPLLLIACVAINLLNARPSAPAAAPAAPAGPQTLTGQGATHATGAFTLAGGAYTVAWRTYPANTSWALPTWRLGVAIHAPGADLTAGYQLLFSADSIPAGSDQSGSTVVTGVAPGTYVLDVAAADSCVWTIILTPR